MKKFMRSDRSNTYSVKLISQSTGIPLSTLYRWKNTGEEVDGRSKGNHRRDYTEIIEAMKEIKAVHPYFGYRRVWAHLKFINNYKIKKSKVLELMREHNLILKKYSRRKGFKRIQLPEVDGPGQMWQIDMTYTYLLNGFPVYIVGIIDIYSRELVSLTAGTRARSKEWLESLDSGLKKKFSSGRPEHDLVLGSDNGCQPTSRAFRNACDTLNISIRYTGYKRPKENGYIERFFRTLKEECLWLNDYETYDELTEDLERFRRYYNEERMHSSLNYRSPYEFLSENFDLDTEKSYNGIEEVGRYFYGARSVN